MSGYNPDVDPVPDDEYIRDIYILWHAHNSNVVSARGAEHDFNEWLKGVKEAVWDEAVGWDTTDIDGNPVRMMTRGNGSAAPNPYRRSTR